MGRLEFHLPFNLKEEVTAAQFVQLPAALKRNACTLCLREALHNRSKFHQSDGVNWFGDW